jgi:WD40 repeat protein
MLAKKKRDLRAGVSSMSQRMSDRVSTSVGSGPRTASVLVLLAACWASACLSDVPIPPCVEDHNCGSGGDAGEADSPGTSGRGGAPLAGAPSLGGAAEGGADAKVEAGGAAGIGSTDTTPELCASCAILPAELIAPCVGRPYSAVLHASGGVAPYAWQLTPAVEGWSIAADPGQDGRALLEAVAPPKGDTALTVRVVDSRGLEVNREYQARARDACWFAYTGLQGGPRLSLVDALSRTAQPAQLEHDANVYDFRFSPDGRYLVYRYGSDQQFPRGRHLALVELSTLAEQPLSFAEDAVTAYAWSPDASVLAVGFLASGDKFLGGVRLPGSGSQNSPLMLQPSAGFVEENLSWVGNDVVAYQAALQPDLDHPGQFLPNPGVSTPLYARLGASSFSAPQSSIDSFDPGVFLQPASGGFWIVNSLTTFFPMTGDPKDSITHYSAVLVDPSGDYSAALDGETLQLMPAHGPSDYVSASSRPGEGCPMPLAWSQQGRVACVADIDNGAGLGSHGEVRLFDVQSGSELLSMSSLLGACKDDISLGGIASCTTRRQGYGYGSSEATGAPRGFSPSGRWFAFTRASGDSTYLYWADLAASSPELSNSLFLPGGSPARLAFSPDNQKLALQVGSTLVIKALSGVSSEMRVTSQLTTLGSCIEDMPSAPNRYCGDTALDAQFKWAPDSAALAYRTGSSVTVVDTSHASYLENFTLLPSLCEAPLCSGDFEFQPPVRY